MYSNKLYIGITTSKSSAVSIFMPLIFEMQFINGALFLNAAALIIYLFIYLFIFTLFGAPTVISPFTTI